MEFNSDGGIFLLELPTMGKEYSVEVPWAVAAEGAKDQNIAESDHAGLKKWLQDNESHFTTMAANRLDPPAHPSNIVDDPRVLAAETLRHI